MISTLKKILKVKTKDNNTISLDEFNLIKQDYIELHRIAIKNIATLRGSISVLKMQLAAAGIRETKKKKPVLNRLNLKLEEEQYYAEQYEKVITILNQGRVPKKIASQYQAV